MHDLTPQGKLSTGKGFQQINVTLQIIAHLALIWNFRGDIETTIF